MKKIFGLLGLATTLCVTAQAQTTLAAWTFDNLAIGLNSSPSPASGLGTASALGMNNSYNNTNSISNPDVQSLAGSSSGGPDCWRIRGYSTVAGSHGNGWSTDAPLGTQGAQFSGRTFGYYKIKVSFDVYATADAEANLQVQYTTDGSTWKNATITSVGTLGVVANNSANTNTVIGSYVILGSGWNNQITVDLTGVPGVDNNPNFAIRLVNASTGTSCVDTTGAVYNNTSGSWTFDNVAIQGTSIDTIADWDFDTLGAVAPPYNNPPATLGYGSGSVLGMNNSYNGTFSTNDADVIAQGGASTGSGSYCWRIRGAPGNGWSTEAPIGTQGAEFDASTAGYSNIVVSFDLYLTTQAEGKMCVLYTTNGWASSNVANNLSYGANPAYILTNSSSANTVMGAYFYQSHGQNWFNNLVVDFTGVPGVASNPQFGIRIVNAATGADCLNALGGTYNNSSGNCRFDNVAIGGTAGNLPPAINFDPHATVDGPFTNTFVDNPAWRAGIAAVYVNGLVLTNSAYTTNLAGEIVFTPSQSTLLQSSGLKNISIIANGFGTARYAQPLGAGVATKLAITTQAAGPAASGGTLIANPVLLVSDQYGNGTTNPYANVSVVASVGGSGGWTLGGDAVQASVNGVIAFTNLTASVNGSTAVSNAFIAFTVTGYPPVTVTNSASFNIGVPPVPFTPGNLAVLKIDTLNNNTTFSIVEVNPSIAGQTTPVNVVPISATGTNALRESSSGSTGRLALSDDGRLLCFAAFVDGSAATPDETLNLDRAAAGLNWSNQLTIGVNYTSISLGGSQARAACVLSGDSVTPGDWIVDDKGGLYQGSTNSGTIASPNLNVYNNVVVKTFGGTPFVETQKAVAGQNIPVVYALDYDGLYDVTVGNNLTTDPNASDFYLISTDGGATYNVLYIADQNSSTQGVIKKYSLVAGTWLDNGSLTANGSFTNSTGVDGLFATTNGNGGVDLFYTTGSGGTGGNSIVRVTDAAGWNQNISIISSNVIYTAAAGTSLKGLTFVPQQTTNAPELVPPPILTAQAGAIAGSPFSATLTPDDAAWRSAITNVTVDGSALPPAAYDTTQSGKIVFSPAQSALLQGSGLKTIVISAAGYSDDTVVQTLSVLQSVLTGVTLNGGNLAFSFTNGPGLSFSVLGTNNLSAPVSTWPVVGTAVESPSGSGHYQFTAPNAATNTAEFYILRQP
jgi:Heme-binding protein Shr-like, Hb-interacting domain